VYKTNPEECTGRSDVGATGWSPGCLNKDKPGLANGRPSANFLRAIQLETLQRSGCSFGLADLSPADWMLLDALGEGRRAIAQQPRDPHD